MSILIPGMEMPTSCGECRFCGEYCYAKGDENKYSKLPCPLIPVPEHDRLIEYHAAVLAVYNGYKDFGLTWRNAEVILGKLPTIIPADKE